MKINEYGQIEITENEAIAALYGGEISDLSNVYLENPQAIEQFNRARDANADRIPLLQKIKHASISIEQFDKNLQNDWFMPKEYQNMDIEEFLITQCSEENYQRVIDELKLFRQHNMIELLKYLKYLVDTMRKNNVVWGVGRGSSVASYCLFLIGVHKVDSIRYQLDIKEFLK